MDESHEPVTLTPQLKMWTERWSREAIEDEGVFPIDFKAQFNELIDRELTKDAPE